MAAVTESCESKVKDVLDQAEKDLKDAEFAGFVGPVANPVKDHVVTPALHIAANVVPPVTAHVPLFDGISATVLGVAFKGFQMGYALLPHVQTIPEQAENQLKKAANQARNRAAVEKEDTDDDENFKNKLLHVPETIDAVYKAGLGYLVNTTLDFVAAPEDKIQRWNNSNEMLLGYLAQFGMDKELAMAIDNPRTTENIIVAANIQHILESVDGRRSKTALKVHPLSPANEQHLFAQAGRFIKFAVAAYGLYDYMVECSNDTKSVTVASCDSNGSREPASLIKVEENGANETKLLDLRFVRFAKYLSIDRSDIVYVTKPGEDEKLIGHYVAVDHQTKSVVLAVRGTHDEMDFSTSPISYCGGVAHKGMAEYALYLWEHRDTRNAIVRALHANPGYQFVITGQSLGAGVANLVHIKCHESDVNLFRGIKSTCYAFGSNPVYAEKQHTLWPSYAACCFNFIQGADIAPFCSVDSVRRLLHTLDAVDGFTSKMSFNDRLMLVRGGKHPTEELVEIVKHGYEPNASESYRVELVEGDGSNGKLLPVTKETVHFSDDSSFSDEDDDFDRKFITMRVDDLKGDAANAAEGLTRNSKCKVLLSYQLEGDQVPPHHPIILLSEHNWSSMGWRRVFTFQTDINGNLNEEEDNYDHYLTYEQQKAKEEIKRKDICRYDTSPLPFDPIVEICVSPRNSTNVGGRDGGIRVYDVFKECLLQIEIDFDMDVTEFLTKVFPTLLRLWEDATR